MSLDALVAEVGQALGDARGLFGPAPEAGEWASTAGLGTGRDGVRQVIGAAARDWTGVGASTYVRTSSGQVQALDSVIGADQGTSPGFAATADSSRGGRGGMDNVVSDTRTGVAALAPTTDTPAGRQQLVNHLQGQLDRAKVLLLASERRNVALAAMIRNAASGYRGPGASMMPAMGASSPMMSPASMSGLGMPNLAGLTNLTRRANAVSRRGLARPAGLHLRSDDIPNTPGAATIRAAIQKALDIKGITNPIARANWESGMMVVSDRESPVPIHGPRGWHRRDRHLRG